MTRSKRVLSWLTALFLCIPLLASPAFAAVPAPTDPESAGQLLMEAGFLSGGATGLELTRTPTRCESVAAFLKLMAMFSEVEQNADQHPFTDVPSWAENYVAVMYKNGWTKGTGETTFGSQDPVSPHQFYTFALRGLGYKDGEDFTFFQSLEKALELNIINVSDYNALLEAPAFTRGDMAVAMLGALKTAEKGGERLLIERLYEEERIGLEAKNLILGIAKEEDPDAALPKDTRPVIDEKDTRGFIELVNEKAKGIENYTQKEKMVLLQYNPTSGKIQEDTPRKSSEKTYKISISQNGKIIFLCEEVVKNNLMDPQTHRIYSNGSEMYESYSATQNWTLISSSAEEIEKSSPQTSLFIDPNNNGEYTLKITEDEVVLTHTIRTDIVEPGATIILPAYDLDTQTYTFDRDTLMLKTWEDKKDQYVHYYNYEIRDYRIILYSSDITTYTLSDINNTVVSMD